MRIFEQEQDRFLTREILELIEQRRQRAAALLGRAERQSRIPVSERDREQRSKNRCGVLNSRCGYCDKRLQLVEALFGRIVCLEPRRSLQLSNERIKRAVSVVRRTLVAQHRVWLAPCALRVPPRDGTCRSPVSPEISTIWPSPFHASRWRFSRKSISYSRPTRSVSPAAWTASKRLAEAEMPPTAHAATGSAMPLTYDGQGRAGGTDRQAAGV